MAGHYKCAKITVLVFAALEIVAGLIFIGLGAAALVTLDSAEKITYDRDSIYDDYSSSQRQREQQQAIIFVGKIFSIALIIGGVLSILNGIVGVVGAAKDHRCLLIFHAVLLALGILGACYFTFTAFSIQNLAGLIISAIRIGLVIYLLQLLKNRDSPPRHQGYEYDQPNKNVAV